MTFASPEMLILLIALPLVWWVGFPRLAFRRRRDLSSLLVRSVLLTLLILALAGLQIVRTVDRMAVAFVVDASDSMGAALQEEQVAWIQAAVQQKPPDDEWALIVFGADVSVDTPFSRITEVPTIRSTVPGGNTNLAAAIQTAISLFPADARRRIVLLTDGQQTIGSAEAKARLAQASGVEISYVLLARDPQPDVRITEFTSPARVAEGQEFDITVSLEAQQATAATLLLFSGGQLIREQEISLEAGRSSYTITQRSPQGGFLDFSAQVIVPGGADDFTQNNRLGTFSQIVGPPRILLVASSAADVEQLLPALQSAGLRVDLIAPDALPADTTALAVYTSIVIANVPAADFSNRQMERIQSYVRDLGGGLVFVGGPDSYGPGGYFQTPLEETLPVETQIRDQQRLPQLSIAYLVDRSGSMGTSGDEVFTNLQLAQRAVVLSIDFLQPSDRVAIGTFDSSGAWVAPFQDVNDKQQLQFLVGTLRPGGGTDIMSGMRLVERDIVGEPSQRKHLILITDGGSSSTGLVELARRLHNDYDVTLSVIAIGTAQPPFLREMAESGAGNYHAVENVGQIPIILAQETVLATRSYIQEGEFAVTQSAISPILQGISALPLLRGYVATTARQTAQVILRAPEPFSDPLLVSWQVGLGRAIAFTSDATSRWAADWVTWGDFGRFWAQVVNASITENASSNIETRVIMEGERARVIVDARDDAGAFQNNLALQASVVAPDGTGRTITLQQTAPGTYESDFLPTVEGAYFISINGEIDAQPFNEMTGWVMSYSPEYARNTPDEELLQELAAITGGRSLREDPQGAFSMSQEPRTAAAPVYPLLLLLALLLLPVDIALRRIIITRSDLQRLRDFLRGEQTEAISSERMTTLISARERVRERTLAGEADHETIAALRSKRESARQQASAQQPAPLTPERPPAPPAATRPAATESTVSSLLKRKKGDSSTPD